MALPRHRTDFSHRKNAIEEYAATRNLARCTYAQKCVDQFYEAGCKRETSVWQKTYNKHYEFCMTRPLGWPEQEIRRRQNEIATNGQSVQQCRQ